MSRASVWAADASRVSSKRPFWQTANGSVSVEPGTPEGKAMISIHGLGGCAALTDLEVLDLAHWLLDTWKMDEAAP